MDANLPELAREVASLKKWRTALIVIATASLTISLASTLAAGRERMTVTSSRTARLDTARVGMLILEDQNGRTCAVLGQTDSRPILGFFHRNDEAAVTLTVSGSEPILRLFDETGQARIVMGITEIGAALMMSDAGGQGGALLDVNNDGDATLQLRDPSGGFSAVLDNQPGTLMLFSESGNLRWKAP